ncbi:ABC transporter ATP-binding protein [Pleomorphomonas sp. PLEO]|uniref:ABC transporter ATP-binding protein n=1 Tax=Pleomorphomonas sp. PLEO TaxID=3239306 RepID=UPI00351E698E
MNQIEIQHLNKNYGSLQVLHDISLDIPIGAFVALVGPSGCGKSTLLRTIAGLETITSGTIKVAGEVVNDKAPRERDLAMVFQSYALYPHMTVEQNMSYSLRLRRRPKAEIDQRVGEAAKILGLEKLLTRRPKQLSGGQRQRVAMGRAIVRNPKVFLFDEPLSNLDAALRVQMRSEIRKLHKNLSATSVYVTHDQIEAMTMADLIVVLHDGRIEQIGKPLDLYRHPANRFVAGFIGSPAMNFVPAEVTADGRAIAIGAGVLLKIERAQETGRKVLAGLRPEHLRLDGSGEQLAATVETVEGTGSMTFIEATVGGALLSIAHAGTYETEAGAPLTLGIAGDDIYLFDPETGRAL